MFDDDDVILFRRPEEIKTYSAVNRLNCLSMISSANRNLKRKKILLDKFLFLLVFMNIQCRLRSTSQIEKKKNLKSKTSDSILGETIYKVLRKLSPSMTNAMRVILTGNFTLDGSKALHVKVNVQHYLGKRSELRKSQRRKPKRTPKTL